MKFLLVTKTGNGLALSHRLQNEGHEVLALIIDKNYASLYDGIIDKVMSPVEAASKKPDIVIFCDNGLPKEYRFFKEQNYKVLGGSPTCDKLEFEKSFSARLAEHYGIRTAKVLDFTKKESAIGFLKKTTRNIFSVTINGNGRKFFNSNEDAAIYLDKVEVIGKIVLQQVIDSEMEVDIEIWFSDGEPLYKYNTRLEQTKFLTGELGKNIDVQSAVVVGHKTRDSKLIERTFNKGLLNILKQTKYTGVLSVRTAISRHDHYPYFLEFIPRFSYPGIYAMLELLININFGDILYDIASGQGATLYLKNEIAISTAISIPPYPYKNGELIMPVEVDIPTKEIPHIWPYDVKMDKDKGLIAAGKSGLLLHITKCDANWGRARNKIGGVIKQLKIADMQYRLDAGVHAANLRRLEEMHYGC